MNATASAAGAGDGAENRRPDYGKGEGGKPGTFPFGDGPDALAGWISGVQWADELDVSAEESIAAVLGEEAWKAVRKHCRRHDIEVVYYGRGEGMAFADFDALPRSVWYGSDPRVTVTHRQVADFTDDVGGENPHEIGTRLKRQRSQRFRERERLNQALNPHGLASDTAYSLAALEGLPGGERIVTAARDRIDRDNRRAWNTPKPHEFREHPYLVTAGELNRNFGVGVASIKTLTPATDAERDEALEGLTVDRRRHQLSVERRAKAGDAPQLELAAEILTMSGLASLEPVTPLIDKFLYRGQLAELVGSPGSGKTFIALGMACAVASGTRWCAQAVGQPMPVVYVAAEGASGVHARVLAWCAVNQVDPAALENMLFVVPRAVQMGEDEHIAQVAQLVAQKSAALVVFDTRALHRRPGGEQRHRPGPRHQERRRTQPADRRGGTGRASHRRQHHARSRLHSLGRSRLLVAGSDRKRRRCADPLRKTQGPAERMRPPVQVREARRGPTPHADGDPRTTRYAGVGQCRSVQRRYSSSRYPNRQGQQVRTGSMGDRARRGPPRADTSTDRHGGSRGNRPRREQP